MLILLRGKLSYTDYLQQVLITGVSRRECKNVVILASHTSLDPLLGLLYFSGVTAAGNFLSSVSLPGEEHRILFTPAGDSTLPSLYPAAFISSRNVCSRIRFNTGNSNTEKSNPLSCNWATADALSSLSLTNKRLDLEFEEKQLVDHLPLDSTLEMGGGSCNEAHTTSSSLDPTKHPKLSLHPSLDRLYLNMPHYHKPCPKHIYHRLLATTFQKVAHQYQRVHTKSFCLGSTKLQVIWHHPSLHN
mmetsp:Transcript_181/g.264  ORF Transcript_181/g.264 Transcript_181/m.264 type:complete len:245 (+) Transcript_181:1202-1936(+)